MTPTLTDLRLHSLYEIYITETEHDRGTRLSLPQACAIRYLEGDYYYRSKRDCAGYTYWLTDKGHEAVEWLLACSALQADAA